MSGADYSICVQGTPRLNLGSFGDLIIAAETAPLNPVEIFWVHLDHGPAILLARNLASLGILFPRNERGAEYPPQLVGRTLNPAKSSQLRTSSAGVPTSTTAPLSSTTTRS